MSKRGRSAIILCICIMLTNMFCGNIHAQNVLASLSTEEKINSQIEDYVNEYIGKGTVGAQVAVIKDGKPVLQKAFGYSDYEKKQELQVDQVMEWGSVTKLFTWISVMQLVEQNRVDLNVDARTYLSEEFLKDSRLNEVKEFTLLQLMNHTAGFEDAIVDLGFKEEDRIVSLEQALCEAKVEQCYKPGTVMAYTNYGAALAGYIVESVTGKDFYEYVQVHILDVLNMKHTTMNPHLSEELKAKKPFAYSAQGDGNFSKSSWTYVSLYPCGSINGTIEDMEKFVAALLPKEGKKSPLFKKEKTLETLFETTYQIADETAGMAHGFFEYDGNRSVYFHKGNSIGFSSVVALDREDRSAILITCNQANESNLVSGLFDMLYDEKANEEQVKLDIDFDTLTWSKTYVPARYVDSGYLRIMRESAFLCISNVTEEEVTIGQLGVKLPFKNQNGNYIYDGGELVLGIDGNQVTHFKLGNMEYVPAPKGRTQLSILGTLLMLVISAIYFLISFIIRTICLLKRFIQKKEYDIILINKWIISVIGLIILINNVLLFSNSLPWPLTTKVQIFIYMNIVLAVVFAGMNLYYLTQKVIKQRKCSFKNILPVVMSTLLLSAMLYWNLFSIS